MAESGYEVTSLSAPIAGLPPDESWHPLLRSHVLPIRKTHQLSSKSYAAFWKETLKLAIRLRPSVIYASDPLTLGPAVSAAYLLKAKLVYHEHDAPSANGGGLTGLLRARCMPFADIIVVPNKERASSFSSTLKIDPGKVYTVWNMPRLSELPQLRRDAFSNPLTLYYHGNISPIWLPEEVVFALRRFNGDVRLRVVGYEAPSAKGYVDHLSRLGNGDGHELVAYEGAVPRLSLLQNVTGADVGLAFAPARPSNVNEQYLKGASNKPFDYLAAGLPVMVSRGARSTEHLIKNRLAIECDSSDASSIVDAVEWLSANRGAAGDMGLRGRKLIETEWNYDVAFAPVLRRLAALLKLPNG
jgi:glycosyltransferase involved in cell wall biosynthesis